MRKRSFSIAGHRTSVSLESAFWDVVEDMAETRELSLAALIRTIDETRGETGLASALRLAALEHALTRSQRNRPE